MRVCLVSPSHLANNPRLVKEARALKAAGHTVTIICGDYSPRGARLDTEIAPELGEVIGVSFGPFRAGRLRYLRQNIMMRLARLLFFVGLGRSGLAAIAHHPVCRDLVRAAQRIKADLYIAHYVAALPAAGLAARANGAVFAFDAEDFHLGDLPDIPANALANRLIRAVEGRWLPQAGFVTAAAPMIAQAYAETYRIALPVTVLNTFPRAGAAPAPSAAGSQRPGPALYWFSQVIGPGRGLECAVRALAQTAHPVHLYLRGTPARGYAEALRALATELGVAERLHLLDPIAPAALEVDGARFDLGYAGDLAETRNRQIALTNKLFSYLSSGLPILASTIASHRALAEALGPAARLFETGNPAALAAAIDSLLADPQALAAARRHSWELGQGRFSWEAESGRLVDLVANVEAPCAAA